MRIDLPHDFTPRPYQARFMRYFDLGGKVAVWIVHRRGGKDLTAMHQTAKMMHKRVGAYWHIYPSFSQARRAIWEGYRKDQKRIMENVFPGFMDPKRPGSIVRKKDDQQMMVELKNGSIWRLLGSDRIEVVGAGPVGVVYSEYAVAEPRARNLIQPMLRENGGWEAYITTPRGRNHAKELYDIALKTPGWFCDLQTLEDTGAWKWMEDKEGRAYTNAEQVLEEERARGVPDALVQQEYNCDWSAALVGSVFGDLVDAVEAAGGMAEFPHPQDGIHTSWDLGFTDATAIWFWRPTESGMDVIDHYENHGKPLSHYFDVVDQRPYRYVKHWLPHDSRQTTLASGVSILNQCLKHWPGQVTCGPDLPLLDGIQAGRWLLQQPIRFHPKCSAGVTALREYHYEYDEETKAYGARPAHNWASHSADAFRYLAGVARSAMRLAIKEAPPPPKPHYAPAGPGLAHTGMTLEQLFADRDRQMAQRRRI